jgi:hypothetical protein
VLANLARGAVTKVTGGPEQDPRVTFTTFFLSEDVHGGQLDPHPMEVLRLSANKAGRPAGPAEPWSCLNSSHGVSSTTRQSRAQMIQASPTSCD